MQTLFKTLILTLFITPLIAQNYELKLEWGHASDYEYKLLDENGKDLQIHKQLGMSSFEGSAMYNEPHLVYTKNSTVRIFNVTTSEDFPVYQFPTTDYRPEISHIEGISNFKFSEDKQKLMFVLITQGGHKDFGINKERIVVLSLDNRKNAIGTQLFDVPIFYECGSGCSTSDFKFQDNNTITYKRHSSLAKRAGEWDIIKLDAEENIIQSIKNKYRSIVSRCKHDYRKTEKDLYGFSSEGADVKCYYDGNQLRRVYITYYGEMGKAVNDYYIWNDEVFFVYRADYQYNSPITAVGEEGIEAFDENKTTVSENRYYFDDGKLIQWIDEDKNLYLGDDANAEFKEEAEIWIKDISELEMKIK
ncbi:MAG: hypothetical protein MK212_01810 [Saprospiraceae bacterium]|nr:hypothetical protein [Saprospiraceae bacterium]